MLDVIWGKTHNVNVFIAFCVVVGFQDEAKGGVQVVILVEVAFFPMNGKQFLIVDIKRYSWHNPSPFPTFVTNYTIFHTIIILKIEIKEIQY